MNDEQKLEQLFNNQIIMAVAVVLDDGTPWVTPVKFTRRGNIFEWNSSPDSLHSKAIVENPNAAITIFIKTADTHLGFYAKGKTSLVTGKDNAPSHYQFVAEECWLNDETFIKRPVSLA